MINSGCKLELNSGLCLLFREKMNPESKLYLVDFQSNLGLGPPKYGAVSKLKKRFGHGMI